MIGESGSSISAVLIEHEVTEESHHGGFVFRQNLCVEYIFIVGFYVCHPMTTHSSVVQSKNHQGKIPQIQTNLVV
jgi:hypothetical protein